MSLPVLLADALEVVGTAVAKPVLSIMVERPNMMPPEGELPLADCIGDELADDGVVGETIGPVLTLPEVFAGLVGCTKVSGIPPDEAATTE